MPTFNKSTAEANVSGTNQYGNRFFVMIDHDNKTFIWGWSTSCFVSPYSLGLITENTTQKAVKTTYWSLSKQSWLHWNCNSRDYKDAMKGA